MSSKQTAIRVDNVLKRFEVYAHPRDQLKQFVLPRLQRLFGKKPRTYFKEFWALQDISLEIRKGESYGLVGLNGSGKSTLLQIITGTLTPTSGNVLVDGRVSALLELGSGFNPDFSGRDNVYMNGALLGLSRQEVEDRLDGIIAFADIGDHFDQELHTYSSGMQMRLAFAVATAFEPDILIIDEALAVGDAYFQQKCFQRLSEFKARGGTLLFVSHDANAVKQLCDRAVLLNHGHLVSVGAPREVIDLYQGLVAKLNDTGGSQLNVTQDGSIETSWQKASTVTTTSEVDLRDFKMLCAHNGTAVHFIESESDLVIEYQVKFKKGFDKPAFGLIVRDRLGRSIFETSTYAQRMPATLVEAGALVKVRFELNMNLRAGQYSFSIGVANKGYGRSEFEEHLLLMHDVDQIQVLDAEDAPAYGGIFNMKPHISITTV